MLNIFRKRPYETIWLSRSRNSKYEVIESHFRHYSIKQWNCISKAVLHGITTSKTLLYENITAEQQDWLQKQGILNCLDLSAEKNYQKPFTCNKKCKETSQLIATLSYKGKIFYILQCPKFNQTFFFWE